MTETRSPQRNGAAASAMYHTRSLCPVCKRVIDAQVGREGKRLIMRKRCPEHGSFAALVSPDADGYVRSLRNDKPGARPAYFATEVREGCPHDCGLCPDHRQHTCLALIEVNTGCNLACPTCFANAGAGYNLTLDEVSSMLDAFVRAEGEPEVVQFSGGEPTLHPQLLTMIQMAKDKGVQHVMVNTNGLRIARDPVWARRLAELRPIIYLQFDGLEDATSVALRGEPLVQEKLQALDRLAEMDLDCVLVAAVERGVNEHEVGALVRFGIEHPAVRAVNFQPVTHTGRHGSFDPLDRVTIPEVVARIEEQTGGMFVASDFVPVPCCHPSCQSVTYAHVEDGQVTPLPRLIEVDDYLDFITNRTWPEPSHVVKHALERMWSSSAVPGSLSLAEQFCDAKCFLFLAISAFEVAKQVFSVSIKDFMDAYTFDVSKVAKCCVGVLIPDGRMVPFCAYNNVGYREDVREAMKRKRAGERLARRSADSHASV